MQRRGEYNDWLDPMITEMKYSGSPAHTDVRRWAEEIAYHNFVQMGEVIIMDDGFSEEFRGHSRKMLKDLRAQRKFEGL